MLPHNTGTGHAKANHFARHLPAIWLFKGLDNDGRGFGASSPETYSRIHNGRQHVRPAPKSVSICALCTETLPKRVSERCKLKVPHPRLTNEDWFNIDVGQKTCLRIKWGERFHSRINNAQYYRAIFLSPAKYLLYYITNYAVIFFYVVRGSSGNVSFPDFQKLIEDINCATGPYFTRNN